MKSKIPTKKHLNLLKKEKTLASPSRLIPVLLMIFVSISLFTKYGVIDRLAKVDAAEAALNERRGVLEAIQAEYADYAEVEKQYNRYTYRDFDRSIPDRLDVLTMLEERVFPVCEVEAISINGRLLALTLSSPSLEETSALIASLESDDLVDYVVVSTAGSIDINESSETVITMTVQLCDAEKESQN